MKPKRNKMDRALGQVNSAVLAWVLYLWLRKRNDDLQHWTSA